MAFRKHTISVNVKPATAVISENTIQLFLSHVRDGFTLTGAAKAQAIKGVNLKILLEKIPKEELNEAMRIGAETLIDDASTCLRNAESKEEIEKSKALAQHYRWLASKLNKERYGDAQPKTTDDKPLYYFNLQISGTSAEIKTVSAPIEAERIVDVNQFLPKI